MIAINPAKLARAAANVAKLPGKVDEIANKKYRRVLMAMFKDLGKVTPQFSGDLASNWYIVKSGGKTVAYKRWPNKTGDKHLGRHTGGVKDAGDPEALDYAYERAYRFVLNNVTYKDKVSFFNPTPLLIISPQIYDETGHAVQMRNAEAIAAWRSISSFLKFKYGVST